MEQFLEFIDRKQRDAKKHLDLIERLLKQNGMQATQHLDEDDPYVFVKSPGQKLSFDGIRIYEIGQMVAYRIQKEEKTHPYGKAYLLDIEDMFNDFMGENMEEEEAGNKVIESVVEEIKKFFDKSAKAEQELKDSPNSFFGLSPNGGVGYAGAVLNRT